jgi:hypothetical protein
MIRRRDPTFLYLAVLAGLGGVMAIAFAIGLPLWARAHGRNISPEFMLFSAWGIAALGGAWACIQTYLLSTTPDHPPRGGAQLRLVHRTEARAKPPSSESGSNERAA